MFQSSEVAPVLYPVSEAKRVGRASVSTQNPASAPQFRRLPHVRLAVAVERLIPTSRTSNTSLNARRELDTRIWSPGSVASPFAGRVILYVFSGSPSETSLRCAQYSASSCALSSGSSEVITVSFAALCSIRFVVGCHVFANGWLKNTKIVLSRSIDEDETAYDFIDLPKHIDKRDVIVQV